MKPCRSCRAELRTEKQPKVIQMCSSKLLDRLHKYQNLFCELTHVLILNLSVLLRIYLTRIQVHVLVTNLYWLLTNEYAKFKEV